MLIFSTKRERRKEAAEKALLKRERIARNDSSAQGQIEVLREQISVIQEKEISGLSYLKFVVVVFTGLSFIGSYQLFNMVDKVTDRTNALVDDASQKIAKLTNTARPTSVSLNLVEQDTNGAIPGHLSGIHLDKKEFAYGVKIKFYTSISVQGYSSRFIGWFEKKDAGYLDWYTSSNNWEIRYENDNSERSTRNGVFERDRAEFGNMSYNKVDGIVTEVIVTPAAPYTGRFEAYHYYKTCEDALTAVHAIEQYQNENGNFGSIKLTPVFDNYFDAQEFEFPIDVSQNNFDGFSCENDNGVEISTDN